MSPNATRIAYSVRNSDRPGRPYTQVWIMDAASGKSIRLGSDKEAASSPRWSADGRKIAYFGREDAGSGVVVCAEDGSGAEFIAPVVRTDHHSSSGDQTGLVARRQTLRVHLGNARPRNRECQRRPDGDRPVLLQAHRVRGPDTLQRQQAASHLRRPHRDEAGEAGDEGGLLQDARSTGRRSGTNCSSSNRESNTDRFFNYDLFALKLS